MRKCCFILPYFGNYPSYFDLFLKTCEYNSKYDWIIFSNNKYKKNLPNNVKMIIISFDKFKNYIQKKFDFKIALNSPYKLCDFKPAYGYIFEEYLKGYEYWGHCDCDLIFGDLNKILSPILNKDYEKIFAAGHLTIYKNSPQNNRIFMQEYNNEKIYKKAFENDKIYAFDEDFFDKNIHSIFISQKLNIYSKDLSMNASTKTSYFTNDKYNHKTRSFENQKYIKARFYWQNGRLFSIEIINNKLVKREYLYMHFQKRKMRLKIDVNNINIIQILPDRFINEIKVPQKISQMNLLTIKCSYLYKLDRFYQKINKRLRRK